MEPGGLICPVPASSKFSESRTMSAQFRWSLVAEHQLQPNFPDAAREEADAAGPVTEDGRTDFRDIHW